MELHALPGRGCRPLNAIIEVKRQVVSVWQACSALESEQFSTTSEFVDV